MDFGEEVKAYCLGAENVVRSVTLNGWTVMGETTIVLEDDNTVASGNLYPPFGSGSRFGISIRVGEKLVH